MIEHDLLAAEFACACVIMTRENMDRFVELAGALVGDPSVATCLLCLSWGETVSSEPAMWATWSNEHRVLLIEFADGEDRRALPIEVSADGSTMDRDGVLQVFHIRKVASGLWALAPSLNIPGVFHGFVVMHGVPEPPPWDQAVIITASR